MREQPTPSNQADQPRNAKDALGAEVDRTIGKLDGALGALAQHIREHDWSESPALPDNLSGLQRLGTALRADLESRGRFRSEFEQQQRALGFDPTPMLELLDRQTWIVAYWHEQVAARSHELRAQRVDALVAERLKRDPQLDRESAIVEIEGYRPELLDQLHAHWLSRSERAQVQSEHEPATTWQTFWDEVLDCPLEVWPSNRTCASNHEFLCRMRDAIKTHSSELKDRPISQAWVEDKTGIPRRTFRRLVDKAHLNAEFFANIPQPRAAQQAA